MSLERFQSRLLEELWDGENAEEIRAKLLSDDSLSEFHAYIRSMDARMIEVAAELVRKWGLGHPS